MKGLFTKVFVFGSLFALVTGAGSDVLAQGQRQRTRTYGHSRPIVRQQRKRLQKLHRVYAHEINKGNRAAAQRAHLQANAIRARLRAHRRLGH